MMHGYYRKKMTDTVAVFDLFFRTNAESSYCVAAGLKQAVEYITNLDFTDEDLDFCEH